MNGSFCEPAELILPSGCGRFYLYNQQINVLSMAQEMPFGTEIKMVFKKYQWVKIIRKPKEAMPDPYKNNCEFHQWCERFFQQAEPIFNRLIPNYKATIGSFSATDWSITATFKKCS